ncbi:hypothetical protein QQF64_006320 [Cirrhinus molitorella]|uniref:Uncharacterized protein n=1 Tax=Cirrhinus molitorella TaxID=172907 RepID=A0ABR3MGW8_9TELE
MRITDTPLNGASFKKQHFVGPLVDGMSVKAQYDDYLRLKDSNTSDLQSEEEQVKNRPKRRPKPIHFFGDSDDKSEEEGHHNKRPRGPTKILNKPPSPVIHTTTFYAK